MKRADNICESVSTFKSSNLFNQIFNGSIISLKQMQLVINVFEDELGSIKEWSSLVERNGSDEFLDKVYKVINHSSSFEKAYYALVREAAERFGFDLLHQNRPTFRIQQPNSNSISFHIDEWAGHDECSLNIWTPLVDIPEVCSLGIVSVEDTPKLINYFLSNNCSFLDFDKKCLNYARFQEMKSGSSLLFGNHTLHGTKCNSSGITRFSFDFRITPKTLSKNNHFRYSRNALGEGEFNSAEIELKKVLYCIRSFGKLAYLSHSDQRIILSSYAKFNNLKLYKECHEIESTVVEQLPFITNFIEKYPNYDLLITSRNCFHEDEIASLLTIEKILARTGNKVHYAI